jgi:site-specific DNA-methyltransferase (adenine-specific)
MKPYYERDGIVIYHGDAREILPTLEPVDLVLTDPPYGVGLETRFASAGRGEWAENRDFPPVYGDDEPFDPRHLLAFPNLVLWGANYYSQHLPSSGQWLIWDKRDGVVYNDQADCEMAWTRGTRGTVPRCYHHLWNGLLRASEKHIRREHPTQKPIALMRWCLDFFPDAQTILDPYMGSGTTLRAAKDLGRKAIGIEIEERYCEIAANRLRQEVLL